VSAFVVPPSQRYRAIVGVYALERLRDGTSWRWLSAHSTIELADLGHKEVRITLRTPPEYPLDGNRVRVNGTLVNVPRAASVDVVVPFAPRIVFTAERSFIPASIAGANNRDLRLLSVMLTKVEQR
jgi:hypothetical protein